jgi:sec-independent protein translocase protein TatB
MFDIGFSEMLLIAVVALIVIGPERLPKVARTLGHLFGRMQRYVNDVKADISREMELEELRKLQTQIQDAAHSFESSVKNEVNAAESQFQKITEEVNSVASDAAASLPPASEPATLPLMPESAATLPPSPEPAAAVMTAEPAPGQLTPAESKAQLSLDLTASPVPADKPV